MRKKVSILIERDLLENAHGLGLNVSRACEDSLLIRIRAIQQARSTEAGFLSPGSLLKTKKVEAGPQGFEPWVSGLSVISGSEEQKPTSIDWPAFDNWLTQKKYNRRVQSEIFSYAQKYQACLINRDFGAIRDASDGLRPHLLKSLSALAKFLGCYEDFRRLVRDHGLKWQGKSTDDLIIDRLTKIQDPDEVFAWIREVKKVRSDLDSFMNLMAISGLRLVEAVDSYNLIIKLSGEGKISEYYNKEKSTLEHFRFKDIFIRRTKKAFVSFVPEELITRISEECGLKSKDTVQKMVQNRGLKLRFGDIREAHATFMIRHLHKEEIDFLHGRIGIDTFGANYFNPSMISDLSSRALKGIQEIMVKIERRKDEHAQTQ